MLRCCASSSRLRLARREPTSLISSVTNTVPLVTHRYKARQVQQPHSNHGQGKNAIRSFATTAEGAARFLNADEAEPSDVVVVGGGVAGLALACALADSPTFRASGANITLVEASPLTRLRSWAHDKQKESGIDDWENRAIYLTEENRAWLDDMGVDPYLLINRLGPVHSMHVTDGLTGAALDFDTPNPAKSRLGTMVEISNLQQAMLQRLKELVSKTNIAIRILDGTKVERIEAIRAGLVADSSTFPSTDYSDAWPLVHLSDGLRPIKARVLVGADGYNSPVREYAGIGAQGWPYGRFGVVGTVKTRQQAVDERTAFQRFLPTGTIAWLPLSHDSASLVWTLPPDVAKAMVSLQKNHEARGDGTLSPVAHLITAGFRLPWSSLSSILTRLASDFSMEVHDDSWIIPTLEEQLLDTSINASSDDNVPAPVASLLDKSVAAFPLKLSHAESYLGSALRQTTFAEAGAGALLPSTILQKVVNGASTLASGMTSDTAPEPPKGPAHGRTVLIGDAAHTIHPLAGQGLNLGLADARSLAHALVRATDDGADLGSHLSLQDYPRERYLANQVMLSAVDHLHWLFVTSPPGNPSNSIIGDMISRAVVWGRSTGFEVLNELDIVKQAIVGAAGSARPRRGG